MRKTTNRLLELAEDGVLSYRDLAMAALKYMSEDEVEDMAQANEFLPEELEPDEEKEDDTWIDPAPYVLFAGDTKDTLYPESYLHTKELAISVAQALIDLKISKLVEIVYRPENDNNINEVVWSSYKK